MTKVTDLGAELHFLSASELGTEAETALVLSNLTPTFNVEEVYTLEGLSALLKYGYASVQFDDSGELYMDTLKPCNFVWDGEYYWIREKRVQWDRIYLGSRSPSGALMFDGTSYNAGNLTSEYMTFLRLLVQDL